MLSNSDCKGKNEADNFFDVLYRNYKIERVIASRSVNSNPQKRGKLTEMECFSARFVSSTNKSRIAPYCKSVK